jgi:DsbC/DsbD-like thiol-disulfide interchange protein
MMKRILEFTPAVIATAFMTATSVVAGPADGVVDLEVLPGWRTDAGTHMAGLQVTLALGWKTYWRVPGDGGIPPRFAWDGSENLNGVALHWPVPDVYHINNIRSIGYEGVIVIPVELAVLDDGAPARMAGRVQIGVCEEICVPVMLDFDAVLPMAGARDSAIVASLIDRPQTAAEAGVRSVTCALEPMDGGLQMTAAITMPAQGSIEEVVIEAGNQEIWVSEPDTWRSGGALYAQSDMIHVNGDGFALNRSDVRITVFAGAGSVDILGCDAG